MWVRLGVLVGMTVLVSGCAGSGQAKELKRLQSQVTLLGDRVGQLERGNANWQSSSSFPTPAADEGIKVSRPSSASKGPSVSIPTESVSTKPTTRQIQQALKNAGFYQGAVDGKMGPVTREAIKEFQRINGLNDDGIVGKQTWGKLSAYADLSGSSGELNAAEILK